MSCEILATVVEKYLRKLLMEEKNEKHTSIMYQPKKPKQIKDYYDSKNKQKHN